MEEIAVKVKMVTVTLHYRPIQVKLYTRQGALKYQTDCAPNNGYYMIPVYDRGEYVLKVEPPPGWTFDPVSVDITVDGATDRCSQNQDINFKFTGFGVVGKVISKGQASGPAGVTLTLKSAKSQDVVQQTTSVTGGGYTFEKVLPGDYVVEGQHSNWMFDKKSSLVTVGRETGTVVKPISILGYDVKGHVEGDGEPVKGVIFLLFSEEVGYDDVHGCDPFPVAGLPTEVPTEPLCYTTSKQDGSFVFGAIPSAKYSLVPFYQGDLITFDVLPAKLSFVVDHNSVTLKEKFQVAGFSVGGTVKTSAKGPGLHNAKVILNGDERATTRRDGSFTLEGMKTGTYSIDVQAEQVSFETTTMKISPNTPQLPDIYVSRFSVCGVVIIDKLPEGLAHLSKQRKVSMKVKGQGQAADETTVLTEEDGKFCTMLKPGTYSMKVALSDTEQKAGLKLTPEDREVQIKDAAVKDIKFTQFRAQVSGKITCLESCGPLQLTLAAVGRHDDRQTVQSQTFTDGSRFTFHNVMPGKYRVSLLKDEWCWKKNSVELDVFDRDVTSLAFVQSGYILSCSLSHDITLNFAQEKKSGNVGSFDLTRGVNKFCLSQPGLYKLSPQSCHHFQQEVFDYDTSSPRVLSLTATSHRMEGTVVTETIQDDILITVTPSADSDASVVIGPLKSDKAPPAKTDKPTKDANKLEKPAETGPFTYKFSHYARGGEKLTIRASSKTLLFYPSSINVTISGDTCPGEVAKFDGKKGVFIVGQIQPALSGVQITITPQTRPGETVQISTNEKGFYKVGPLHGDQDYSIAAHMEGYVLTPGDKKGDFKAFKLGEINVEVLDETNEPLPGVLLSLTGGNAYRSNNLTHANGSIKFSSLSPGQYFLRPMMKEYSFNPTSQMIEVKEGSSVTIRIKGLHVAFSCYGAVTSLNGEPEPEVYVEAVGVGSDECRLKQEESKTEADGSFRIRGLQPECEYTIQLRSGDVNQHIERAAPKHRQIKVKDRDVKDVHVIAFRRLNQLDLSGNVITSSEYLSTIKIHLYKERNMDSPVHSTGLGTTSFFYLPSLRIDSEEYILKLESSLSKSTHEHHPLEITFVANSTYRHFTFTFDPKRKSIDQELSQGSILALPLTLLVVFLAYNHKQILPFAAKKLTSLRTMTTKSHTSGETSVTAATSSPSPIDIQMIHKKQKPRKA